MSCAVMRRRIFCAARWPTLARSCAAPPPSGSKCTRKHRLLDSFCRSSSATVVSGSPAARQCPTHAGGYLSGQPATSLSRGLERSMDKAYAVAARSMHMLRTCRYLDAHRLQARVQCTCLRPVDSRYGGMPGLNITRREKVL